MTFYSLEHFKVRYLRSSWSDFDVWPLKLKLRMSRIQPGTPLSCRAVHKAVKCKKLWSLVLNLIKIKIVENKKWGNFLKSPENAWFLKKKWCLIDEFSSQSSNYLSPPIPQKFELQSSFISKKVGHHWKVRIKRKNSNYPCSNWGLRLYLTSMITIMPLSLL